MRAKLTPAPQQTQAAIGLQTQCELDVRALNTEYGAPDKRQAVHHSKLQDSLLI